MYCFTVNFITIAYNDDPIFTHKYKYPSDFSDVISLIEQNL